MDETRNWGFFSLIARSHFDDCVMKQSIFRFLVFMLVLASLGRQASPVFAQAGGAVFDRAHSNLNSDLAVTPQPTATALPVAPLLTSTPNPDGSIVHVVGAGQSLWSIAIAYGVKIADILKLNNLNANTQVVYAGQKLTIRKANPATQTPGITATHPPATKTPTVSPIPGTPTPVPTETVTPTTTPTPVPTSWISAWVPQGAAGQKAMGIAIVAVCVLGLVVVGVTGFRKR